MIENNMVRSALCCQRSGAEISARFGGKIRPLG
jgi:hypothetical protein